MNNKLKRFFLLASILLFLPLVSEARLGVGVGSGKIYVDGKLKPGGFYELPLLPVLNTGDVPADYAVSVEFNETQPQKRPDRNWFEFSPASFHLEPNKVQTVKVILNVPIKTEPGDYFAYLEAHPVVKPEAGVTSVGIAAASKLYFTVEPANFFEGLYYKSAFFMKKYSPWSWSIFGALIVITLLSYIRTKVSFKISFAKK